MLYEIGKVEPDSILDMSIFFFLPDFDKIYYFVLQEIINPLKQKEEALITYHIILFYKQDTLLCKFRVTYRRSHI